MTQLIVVRKHDELLPIWRAAGKRGISLLHVDFHDDLRGLLIDRGKKNAYPTGLLRPGPEPPDEGNFLAHAVMEGLVGRIRWVRGRIGGRAYDSGIVKYREDIAALPHRLAHSLRGGKTFSLEFSETIVDDWNNILEEEHLDIDWDAFASIHLDREGMLDRFTDFLNKCGERRPTDIYLCYSPNYVHPSRDEFLKAIELLSKRFGCAATWPGSNFISNLPETPPRNRPLSATAQVVSFFRWRGIF